MQYIPDTIIGILPASSLQHFKQSSVIGIIISVLQGREQISERLYNVTEIISSGSGTETRGKPRSV